MSGHLRNCETQRTLYGLDMSDLDAQDTGAGAENDFQENGQGNAPVLDRIGDDLQEAVRETQRTLHVLHDPPGAEDNATSTE